MSVYIWGSPPTQEETTIPKTFTIPFPILKVSCGEEHILLLANNHQLYSMGSNNHGALGIGSDDYSIVNCTPVQLMPNVTDIDCGWNHSIAINQNGIAFTWGKGHGTNDILKPKQLATSVRYGRCGGRHTMIITQNSQLLSIGANDVGQCGISDTKKLLELTPVMDDVVDVACGVSHSLIKSDFLYSCGSNNLGQLGIQGLKSTSKPLIVDIPQVDKIAAGNHSAAVSKGVLYVWGTGSFGTYTKPTVFCNDIVDIQIGGTSGLALDSKQQLYAWGSNVNGELGIGDQQPRNETVKVPLKNVTTYAVGIGFAIAAIKSTPVVQTEMEYLEKTLQIESVERSALERINRELKQRIYEYEQQQADLSRNLQQRDDECRNLQNRNNILTSELSQCELNNKELRQQNQRHQSFQKEAVQKLQTYEEIIKELENNLSSKSDEVDQLQNQLGNFQNNFQNYQEDEANQLAEFKEQLQELTEQLQYEQQNNEQLTQQLNKEKDGNNSKNGLLQQYEFEIGSLTQQNRTLQQQTQSSLNQHHKLSEALTMANHRIESLQTQNAKLMQDHSLLRTTLYSDTQKPQVLEVQAVLALNKELTDLNNQLQGQLRQKDQDLLKMKSLGLAESRHSSQKSLIIEQPSQQKMQNSKNIQQSSPMGKTITELLESAHKHAKFMKKVLHDSVADKQTPSPKRKLQFSKENTLSKPDCLSDVRNRLTKLQQNRQTFEQKLRI